MLLWPDTYYTHYGAFAGPFIALVVALPVGLLRPAEQSGQIVAVVAAGLVAAMLIGERLGLAGVADGVQRLADGRTVGRVVFTP